jgi:O-antigen ligase
MSGLIFTYLMTYGGAAVALFRPYVGLLIYVCFAIIKPELTWEWAVPAGSYSKTIAIAMAIGWLLQRCGTWDFGRGRNAVLLLVLFLGWVALSAAAAPDTTAAWTYLDYLAKIVFPFVVGATLVQSPCQLKQLAWVIALSVGYIAFLENEKYFTGVFRERENLTAHTLMIGAGLTFHLGLTAGRRWQTALAFGMAALMVHGVFIHESRGAMLGLVVIGVMTFLIIPKRPRHYALLVVIAALAVASAGKQVKERFETVFASAEQRDASAQSRLDLWRDMFDAARRNPLLGVGPAHWHLIAQSYGWPQGKDGHGLWVQYTAELGFPGGFAILAFYLSCVIALLPWRRHWHDARSPELRHFACMAVGSLPGFMVGAQFGSFSGMELPYYVALLGVGTLRLLAREKGMCSGGEVPLPGPPGHPRALETA